MVSQNLDYCSRKVRHFLKYPTVTVKIIPSSLKFSSLCREHKAFNNTLIACKIRSVYQFGANQKEWKKTNSLQAVKQDLLKGQKLTSNVHDASKMATLHAKNREKLPHGIMGRRHNPPLVRSCRDSDFSLRLFHFHICFTIFHSFKKSAISRQHSRRFHRASNQLLLGYEISRQKKACCHTNFHRKRGIQ